MIFNNINLGSKRCCVNNITNTVTGSQGFIGRYGPIGEGGVTGFTGPTGATGPTGLCYRGYMGPQGPIGPSGTQSGAQGAIGPIGPSGSNVANNINISFITTSNAFYNSTATNLLTLTNTTPISTITLDSSTYSVNWEIFENWVDPNNNFYILLNNIVSGDKSFVVFNNNSPCVLFSNGINLYGIGNDFIDLTTTFGLPNTYTVELYQYTNSGIVSIPNKSVKFSLTFVKTS